ncbi:OmpA family protein [Parasalinivibrio latis]|uniref:OmpA family protein n=1 Tax=Parasalinivibrio latis TaxID=2952610 RepID=UPI0030E21F67
MKKVVTGLGLAVLALSPLAHAQDDSSLYLGGRFGVSHLSDNACNGAAQCDKKDIAGGVIAGYDFNKIFGLEATYDYLGHFKGTFDNGAVTQKGDLTEATFGPRISLPITDATSLYVKGGASFWDMNGSNSSAHDTAWFGAAGVNHRVSDLVDLRAEFQHVDSMDDGFVKDVDNNLFTVGMTFHFGRSSAAPVVAAPVAAVVEEVVAEEVVAQPQVIELSDAKGSETFAFNSSELTDSAKTALKPLVERMKTYPQATVVLTGHTDSTGPEKVNVRISKERAEAVAKYLEANGVAADRITVKGEGEANPVASNKTAEGRAQNRRVDIFSPAFSYTE